MGALRAVFNISEFLDVLSIRGVIIDVINVLGPLGAAITYWEDLFTKLDFKSDTSYNVKPACGRLEIFPLMLIRNNDFKRQDSLLGKPELNNTP